VPNLDQLDRDGLRLVPVPEGVIDGDDLSLGCRVDRKHQVLVHMPSAVIGGEVPGA